MGISTLWKAPELNPINHKARSIPFFNPINVYGRVFHVAWFGFFVAFWSWYAFPPLLGLTIAKDIGASTPDQLNSSIVALAATLLVRLVSGPLCDRFGPRYVFAGILLVGALPTFAAGGVTSVGGLIALRFFLGLIGGSFVPCQVWSTGFFDKNVVGTANALTAGLGNAGGGVTYFLMPAIFDALVGRGLTPHVAWRVAFVIPGIIILLMAAVILTCCPDTPTGSWATRHLAVQRDLAGHGIDPALLGVVDVKDADLTRAAPASTGASSPERDDEKKHQHEMLAAADAKPAHHGFDHEAAMAPADMLDTARGEIVVRPTLREARRAVVSAPTLVLMAAYFCTFGAELAVNNVLGNYFVANFPKLGQTGSGNWAAMFGLLNVVCRPVGGAVSDAVYRRTRNLWLRKLWMHFLILMTGVFLVAIGAVNSHAQSTMFGLVAGLAFFLEAANGANFALVPHVHPYANGIVSGVTGAAGNLGGIVFAIVFRFDLNGAVANYARSLYIIGAMVIAINFAVVWIRPVPKNQIGGR